MLVKGGQFTPEAEDVLHFAQQNAVQFINVLFYITLRLFNLLENTHILLDDVDNVVNMLSVLRH